MQHFIYTTGHLVAIFIVFSTYRSDEGHPAWHSIILKNACAENRY